MTVSFNWFFLLTSCHSMISKDWNSAHISIYIFLEMAFKFCLKFAMLPYYLYKKLSIWIYPNIIFSSFKETLQRISQWEIDKKISVNI